MKTKVKELPEDVLGDILVRLPVKSLVRLRCVSNSWLSLITHHTFVRLHLNYHHHDHERDENHKNQLQMDGVIRIQPHKSFSYEYGEIDVGYRLGRARVSWARIHTLGPNMYKSSKSSYYILYGLDMWDFTIFSFTAATSQTTPFSHSKAQIGYDQPHFVFRFQKQCSVTSTV